MIGSFAVKRSCLEAQLNRQLHVELLAGPEAGSAVEVANGVGDLAEAWLASMGGKVFIATGADRANTRSKIDAVEGVEHVGAQLNVETLGNRNVLNHRQ